MTVLIFNMKFYFIFEKDLKYCFVCPGLQSQSWKSSLLLIIYKLPISMPRNKINDPIINIFSQKMIYSRFLIPMFCLKFLFFTVFFTKQYLISRHIRTHLKLYYYTMSFWFQHTITIPRRSSFLWLPTNFQSVENWCHFAKQNPKKNTLIQVLDPNFLSKIYVLS